MQQKRGRVLAVGFTCPTTVEVGDVAVITSSDNTIQANSAEGSTKIVGTIAAHIEDATSCVVETKFRERRDDRVAASVFANGPFVWGATGLATPYVAGTIASVTGTEKGPFTIAATAATPAVGSQTETFTFEAAAGGTVTGTGAENFTFTAAVGGTVTSGNGPFTFGLGASDAFKIKIGTGAEEPFTLSGASQTAAQVVTQFAAATTFIASVSGTAVKFTAVDTTKALEIIAVSNDCYTVMGLTAASHAATTGDNKLSITIGSGGPQVITLTGSGQTAALTAAQITGTGFTATASGTHVKLAATGATDSLTINSVTNNCYTTLGIAATEHLATPGNNKLSVTVEGGDPQVFTLSGTARTAVQVAGQISGTGFAATADDGSLVLTASDATKDLTINNTDNDCYTELGLSDGTYASVEGNNKLKIAITGGSESGGADQTFTITGDERTVTQVKTEINLTSQDFGASVVGGYLVLTCDQIGDDLVIKAIDADAYTDLGLTAATTTGDVPTYSPASIVGLQIEGPSVNWIQCGIPGPYVLTGTDNVIKVTIASGSPQTFTLGTGTAVTATSIAATIMNTATNLVASSVDDYLRITADAAGKNITLSTVANDAYDVLGWTTDTYEASMAIVTLEK